MEPGFGTRTQWVVTMPTRRFYTDAALHPAPIAPFHKLYPKTGAETAACMPVGLSAFDVNSVPTAPLVTNLTSCFSVQTILPRSATQSGDDLLGSTLVSAIANLPPTDGRGQMRLFLSGDGTGTSNAMRPALDGSVLLGLPAIGFAVFEQGDPSVAGGARYRTVSPQRVSNRCESLGLGCL